MSIYIISLLVIIIIIFGLFHIIFFKNRNETNYFLKGNTFNFIETLFEEKEEIYVSIDFGNYESKYAYNIGEDIDKIRIGNMGDYPSLVVLYTSNHTAKNYGLKSSHSISNYNKDELSQIIYIDNLKLKIFEKKKKDEIEYRKNKIYKKAIIEYLKLFSDDALKEINSKIRNEKNKYKKEEVNWIITTPNLWDDINKLNLMEYAKQAGMNNIDLVIETEVALIQYYFANNKNLKEGEICMIINLGDYIVDISIFRIIEPFGIYEKISYSLGGTFGSMNINNDIINIIKDGLGKEIIENAKKNNFGKYLETLEDIEAIKKKINGNEAYNYEINAKFKKMSIWEKFFKSNRNSFTYNNQDINYDENKIYFPANIFIKIIENRVNNIIEYVKEISNLYLEKNVKIDHVILTGGFSNCNILRQKFHNISHDIIFDSNNLALKGALIYKIHRKNNDYIKFRFNQNSYWIENFKKIQENEICKKKISKNGYFYCCFFEKLIEKGQKIPSNFKITKFFEPININQTYIYINFYKSNSIKLENSDDDYFGTLEINLINQNITKDFKLKILMTFNEFLKFKVINLYTNKSISYIFHLRNQE